MLHSALPAAALISSREATGINQQGLGWPSSLWILSGGVSAGRLENLSSAQYTRYGGRIVVPALAHGLVSCTPIFWPVIEPGFRFRHDFVRDWAHTYAGACSAMWSQWLLNTERSVAW